MGIFVLRSIIMDDSHVVRLHTKITISTERAKQILFPIMVPHGIDVYHHALFIFTHGVNDSMFRVNPP